MITAEIDWTPRLLAISYTIGGNTFPYSHQVDEIPRDSDDRYLAFATPTNIPITFTSEVFPENADEEVIEYRWNMGDGVVLYGPSVTHTYITAVDERRVSLTIWDTKGNRYQTGNQLHLRYAEQIAVSGNVIRL